MPNPIQIKRRASGVAGPPDSLLAAELAYNEVNNVLYIGKSNTTIIEVGGAGAFASLSHAHSAMDLPADVVYSDDARLARRNVAATVGRSEADFICSGSAESPTDHLAIQEAIDEISETGGVVWLREGTYYLGDTITVSSPNIRIIGSGRATELRAMTDYGDVFSCALEDAPEYWPGLSGLVFSDLRLETAVGRTHGAAIRATYTHDAQFHNIYICDTTYGISYGNAIAEGGNPFWDGIYLDKQDQCDVSNITAQCKRYSVYLSGSGFASADFSYDGIVRDCDFYGVPGATKYGTGIYVDGNCGGVVISNVSCNQLEHAVEAHAGGSQGGGIITIRGGYAENNSGHGYWITGYQNIVVTDLWGGLTVDGGSLTVIGVPNGSIEINGGTALIFASPSTSVSGTGTWAFASGSVATASATVLGGVKVGSGLSIDGSGVLSATGAAALSALTPPAPTAVTATAGTNAATVGWSSDPFVPNLPNTGYVIQRSSNGGASWTTFSGSSSLGGSATSVSVTGLSGGTAYVFRVAAKNAFGTGAYSSASSAVTPSGDGGAGDEFFSSVSLLLHMDGPSSVTDSSSAALGFTSPPGTFNATEKKFGDASYSVDSQDGLSTTTRGVPDLSSVDWTVEGWVYRQSDDASYQCVLFLNAGDSTDSYGGGLNLYINQNGAVDANNGFAAGLSSESGTVPVGQWVHLALVRLSGVTTLYVDGVASGTTLQAPAEGPYFACIGWIPANAGFASDILVDEVRITAGVARYSANFTPPSSEFPDA